ncbi:precorrin-6x reductase [Syntrophobotulus glycolicus DSM 8271]|uniref:Precorrin-6x reductase n=1 Tax=Syntrophobotulus glycolicus (strain DSM 8271 / FlGlyR) TaxID=645991 RepID=F0SZ40_SYNGF|nr:precorrin-6A reductase [Syntrophobotulus glycolicus]ADY57158.1 precorrin-6x reductase [Syntrophobotulus glycolicus DSM 8271]
MRRPEQPVLWIIAGTTEGRKLVESLAACDVTLYVSLATDYGLSFFPEKENVRVEAKRLSPEEMVSFLRTRRPDCVIDTTHPYAQKVTSGIDRACRKTGTRYIRLLRPAAGEGGSIRVRDTVQAAAILRETKGNVFLACGSKEIQAFTSLPDFAERVYARILPAPESLEKCLSLGFKHSHMICMQGPFSRELNAAMLKATAAAWLVTKDSGEIGGYHQKIEAAGDLGIPVVVIGRPEEGEGLSFAQVVQKLQTEYGLTINDVSLCRKEDGRDGNHDKAEKAAHGSCQESSGQGNPDQ